MRNAQLHLQSTINICIRQFLLKIQWIWLISDAQSMISGARCRGCDAQRYKALHLLQMNIHEVSVLIVVIVVVSVFVVRVIVRLFTYAPAKIGCQPIFDSPALYHSSYSCHGRLSFFLSFFSFFLSFFSFSVLFQFLRLNAGRSSLADVWEAMSFALCYRST